MFGFSVSTILLMAIAASIIVVYLPYLAVVYARVQVGFSREMLSKPRATLDLLPAYGQRATWAHQNCWEAFTMFGIAALMAYVTQVDSPQVMWAAIAFVPARLLFSVFYIADIPPLRSLMFGIGSICIWILIGSSITGSIN
jgi:uncharacterized MAPEG superfamily protein